MDYTAKIPISRPFFTFFSFFGAKCKKTAKFAFLAAFSAVRPQIFGGGREKML